MFRTLTSALALGLALTTTASAQEAKSTVNATYVAESATTALAPGEKIENLFTKDATQPYILQKLTDRVFFFQSGFYGTVFYVGDEGVLLIDALEGSGDALQKAVAEVTDLPVTDLIYTHDHADHIADAAKLQGAYPGLTIHATEATTELMERLGSNLPRADQVIEGDTLTYEDLTVRVVPLNAEAHAHDHAAFILEGTGVVHVPDVINPDQPPFWSFAGADSYLGYRDLIAQIDSLEWDYLSGGHGNVGSRDGIAFYNRFLDDLEAAVGEALGTIAFGTTVENPAELNAHTAYLST
ncbi:MBL fold metallo-hydrolase [Tropicibacter naphthalenivorans]|uniref:Hydroxyacylglutathione hydrolase n=1 Tax=Tropicibacter naphthalenivorans TaxID=441103 RepID=A0A0P1GKN1_9RHOB|nr:MBL fold metallo-hydrolase [Tropicibacter naphthalenivorans]CUH82596.1 hydroxyacylglutathione hydrolase [Tropicibacter naphthalenivorans]SMD09551.1 Glyoxylase, beta-lactamase superfamily II [Tropicibacter naphthalenivorans]